MEDGLIPARGKHCPQMDGRAANIHGSEGSWLCPVHFALGQHLVRLPALLSELGDPPRGEGGDSGALPSRQQLEAADRTSPLYSTIPLPHQMVFSPTPTKPANFSNFY